MSAGDVTAEPAQVPGAGAGSDRAPGEPPVADSPAPRVESAAEAPAAPAAVAAESSTVAAAPRRRSIAGRLVAFAALVLFAIVVAALVAARAPVAPLSQADATFMSGQLIAADQAVRTELARLRALGLARARDRTRDAFATTRSLALEIRNARGGETERLRRALRLQGAWLDAVGSTLANPRSPLRAQLVGRDVELRPALAALPGPGQARAGASQQLLRYALSRQRAQRPRSPSALPR